MALITQTDIENRIGAERLVQLADRDQDGAADAAVVSTAIDTAISDVQSRVLTQYKAVPDPAPAKLVQTACDLAVYYLYKQGTVKTPGQVRQDYEDAVAYLKGIARGEVKLSGGALNQPAAQRTTQGTVTGREEATFDREKLEDF